MTFYDLHLIYPLFTPFQFQLTLIALSRLGSQMFTCIIIAVTLTVTFKVGAVDLLIKNVDLAIG